MGPFELAEAFEEFAAFQALKWSLMHSAVAIPLKHTHTPYRPLCPKGGRKWKLMIRSRGERVYGSMHEGPAHKVPLTSFIETVEAGHYTPRSN